VPAYASPGGIVEHTYKEGIYDAKILDLLLMVKKTEVSKKWSFHSKRQKNLVVTIEMI
jgi:hypothetical protein